MKDLCLTTDEFIKYLACDVLDLSDSLIGKKIVFYLDGNIQFIIRDHYKEEMFYNGDAYGSIVTYNNGDVYYFRGNTLVSASMFAEFLDGRV